MSRWLLRAGQSCVAHGLPRRAPRRGVRALRSWRERVLCTESAVISEERVATLLSGNGSSPLAEHDGPRPSPVCRGTGDKRPLGEYGLDSKRTARVLLAVVDADDVSDLIVRIHIVSSFATFDDGNEPSGIEVLQLEIIDFDPRRGFRLRLWAIANGLQVLGEERRENACDLSWIGRRCRFLGLGSEYGRHRWTARAGRAGGRHRSGGNAMRAADQDDEEQR